MMLPSAVPTILLVAAIARQRSAGSTGSTGLFASGYIVVWKGFSLGATVLQWALDRAGLGGRPDDWAANRGGCDRISLPRNPQGRKIATNNFGIREMSAHPTEPMQARVDSRRCYRVSNNA